MLVEMLGHLVGHDLDGLFRLHRRLVNAAVGQGGKDIDDRDHGQPIVPSDLKSQRYEDGENELKRSVDRVVDIIANIDIAADLKRQGIKKGSRVLVLSDENLEKLLIWLGVWRLGAVICPFNLEINEKQMVALTAALDPAIILYHKEIDVAAMVGDARAPRDVELVDRGGQRSFEHVVLRLIPVLKRPLVQPGIGSREHRVDAAIARPCAASNMSMLKYS